jgi:hypothetical protein
MKRKRFTHFLTAINSAAVDALNSVSGVWQELSLAEGEKEVRYRLAPYGEHPVRMDGRKVMQVVDREAAELMASNFKSLTGKLANFFQGIPVYEGHADDADWLRENPGHRAVAVGRIKEIEAGEDGIYVRTVFNSEGVKLLSGTAPSYSGHSPRWRMIPIPGSDQHFRPFLLWSDALTNSPNMADNTIAMNSLKTGETPPVDPSPVPDEGDPEKPTDTMKLTPEAMQALGFSPDATPTDAEISAAIVKLLSAKTTAEADKATSDTAVTAANSRTTYLETEINAIRGAAVATVISAALQDGRISEADKPRWMDALNTSFATESEKLSKLMPTVSTRSHLPAFDRTIPELSGSVDAINSAVEATAKAHGLNLQDRSDYDKAHELCRTEKPELFQRG